MIVNYDCKEFIVQATDLILLTSIFYGTELVTTKKFYASDFYLLLRNAYYAQRIKYNRMKLCALQ